MKIIGLTGGVGTGKTTAVSVLAQDGVTVLTVDTLEREVMMRGEPAFRSIVDHFGRAFIGNDGQLDRRRLSNVAFSDGERRAQLDGILLPRVTARALERLAAWRKGDIEAVLFEHPLLFECDWDENVTASILIALDTPTQRERISARDQLSGVEARRRIATQMAMDAKRKRATISIDNTGTHLDLARNVRTAWGRLVGGLA